MLKLNIHIFILLCTILSIIGVTNKAVAQEEATHQNDFLNEELADKKNELKLNLAYAPFGYLEASYERLLPANTSIGLAFGKSIKEDIDLNYHLILFYRIFFGHQIGKGFFIEANGAIWKDDSRFNNNDLSNGVGLAVGGKFFRGDNFHGEFVFGYGRTITDNSFDFGDAYPRFAISVGQRF